MKKTITILSLAAGLAGVLAVSACSQMPTAKPAMADTRPQISFTATTERVLNAKVILDGRDRGLVSSYLAGAAALRIDAGLHMLIVASENRLIYQQTFDTIAGGSRSFTVR